MLNDNQRAEREAARAEVAAKRKTASQHLEAAKACHDALASLDVEINALQSRSGTILDPTNDESAMQEAISTLARDISLVQQRVFDRIGPLEDAIASGTSVDQPRKNLHQAAERANGRILPWREQLAELGARADRCLAARADHTERRDEIANGST